MPRKGNFTDEQGSAVAAYIAQARQQYTVSTDDIEIDEKPEASVSESGAWISAWLWVDRSEVDRFDQKQPCAAKT